MANLDYLENLNSLFVELTSNYLETSNLLIQHFNTSDTNNDTNNDTHTNPLLDNNIMQVEASMNDLLINLQNLKFSLGSIIDKPISNSCKVPPLTSEMDKLINKAIKDMMPMMMMHLMQIDPNSILNKPTTTNSNTSDSYSGPYDVD